VLMDSDIEIRQKFANTDFDKQRKLLRKALLSAITFSAGGTVARERLEVIRTSHNRMHLDIRPEFYPVWVDSLVKSVSVCDPKYSGRLDADWRAVLQPTVDFLISGYMDY